MNGIFYGSNAVAVVDKDGEFYNVTIYSVSNNITVESVSLEDLSMHMSYNTLIEEESFSDVSCLDVLDLIQDLL